MSLRARSHTWLSGETGDIWPAARGQSVLLLSLSFLETGSLFLAKLTRQNLRSALQLLLPFHFLELPLPVWVLPKFSQEPEKWGNHSVSAFLTAF